MSSLISAVFALLLVTRGGAQPADHVGTPLTTFAAGRPIAPRPLGPTPYNLGRVHTVFAANRYLTTWIESQGEMGHSLMGILHDANGRRLSERTFMIQPFFSEHWLVGIGHSFALFWLDRNGLHLSNIDAQGNVTRTKSLDIPPFPNLRIAWNGERYFVLQEPHVYLLDRSGAMVAAMDLDEGSRGISDAIAPFGGGFTLFTINQRTLFAQRIADDGAAEPVVTLVPYVTGTSLISLVSAPTATGTLIVWSTHTLPTRLDPGSRELRSMVFHTDGSTGRVRVLAHFASNEFVTPMHLSRGAGLYVLTFVIHQAGDPPGEMLTLALRADGMAQTPIRSVTTTGNLPWHSAASSGPTTLVTFASPTTPPRLTGLVIAQDGTISRPAADVAITPARQRQPALTQATSRLLAGWTEDSPGATVHTSSLRTDGSALSPHALGEGQLASYEIPWNGAESLVLIKRDAQLYAAFVDLDGAPLPTSPVLLGEISRDDPARLASTVWTGDRWLVAWAHARGDDINVASLRNDAAPEVRTLALSTTVPAQRHRWFEHVVLARNATNTLLVWTEELRRPCPSVPSCGDDQYRTYSARLTADGEFAGGPLAIPGGSRSLSVATSGDEFMIVAGGTATVVEANARRVLRSTTVFNWEAASDVAWDGSAYAIALRYHLARWYVASVHLDRRGNRIGEKRGTATPAADALAAPSISGSVIALQEGDLANGAGAVVYDERALSPLPPPPPSPVPRIRRTGFGSYKVSWDPVPGAELYAIETELLATEQTLLQVVPADSPQPVEVAAGAIRLIAIGPGGASSPPPKQRSARR